ncbi:MAG TPA: MATE family efflux transporter [Myxococcales bacterium]|nr:MATE family efflux transporter [Myxococcales bacterium]HAN30727.1 MATE family efflux transporter [Myxococcales bacterium]
MAATKVALDFNRLDHRSVVRVALPIALANISTPLVGMVDLGVVGHTGGASEIGAVAAGSLILSLLFWGFGFLKMTTSGLSAQAQGRQDTSELSEHLYRGLAVATCLGLFLVCAQAPLLHVALDVLGASTRVTSLIDTYLSVRIWAAPATLGNYVLLGWLIGRAQTRRALGLQLVLNVSNIVLSLFFTLGLKLGVAGVAWGSVLAECITLSLGLLLLLPALDRPSVKEIVRADALRELLSHNRDVMIRTLTLLAVFAWFTLEGAQQGDDILAANSLLMQLVNLSAYILDGLAAATESLTGQAIGSRRPHLLGAILKITLTQGAVLGGLLALLFGAIGPLCLGWLTDDFTTIDTAIRYLPWAILAPLLGVVPFIFDGLFIGALQTRALRNAMLGATACFAFAWVGFRELDNHGLWAAVSVHYLARGLLLGIQLPALRRTVALPSDETSAPLGS